MGGYFLYKVSLYPLKIEKLHFSFYLKTEQGIPEETLSMESLDLCSATCFRPSATAPMT